MRCVTSQAPLFNSIWWFLFCFNELILLIFLDLLSYSIQSIDLSFFDNFYLFFISLCLSIDLNLIALAFALLFEHFYSHDNHDNHVNPNISENKNDKTPAYSVVIFSFVIYNEKYE